MSRQSTGPEKKTLGSNTHWAKGDRGGTEPQRRIPLGSHLVKSSGSRKLEKKGGKPELNPQLHKQKEQN